MSTSLESLAPKIVEVENLADQLYAAAANHNTGESEELHATLLSAARTFLAVVQSWATKQAQEVVDGTRTLANWTSYGDSLKAQAAAKFKDIQDQTSWFTQAWDWLSSKVKAGVDAVAAKVAQLRADVTEIGKLRQNVLAVRPTLAKVQDRLSAESRDTLFGVPWTAADATWSKLTGLVDALEATISFVRNGTAKLEPTANGDARVVALSGPARSLLGALPALAAGTVLATIAIAAALAVSLHSYYEHANQVTRAELESQENQLVASGKLTTSDLAKIRQQRQVTDQQNKGDDLAGTIVKGVVGAVAAGALIYGGTQVIGNALKGGGK